MKLFTAILLLLASLSSFCQNRDSTAKSPANKPSNAKASEGKPEVLNNGFIDVINNGQVNASARLIRLFIGEPGKFAIPLSFYSGVSANNFSNGTTQGQNNPVPVLQKTNDQLVTGFINPLSGFINVSVDNVLYFKKTKRLTKAGWLYHTGIRILTGYKTGAVTNPQTGKPVNFLNSFASSGFYFQTGAWEKNNAKNMGVFWTSLRYIWCRSNPNHLKEFLPNINTNGIYHGYCVGGGIEINNLVNIKILFYKYSKRPEIDYSLPIYQFSFNYSMK